MIRRICCYCQRQYEVIDCKESGDSHGICPACAKLPDSVREEMGRKVRIEKAKRRNQNEKYDKDVR